MLTSLSIKNYALIDDIQVDFGEGLTIITGETGAGKSILLGGLSLVLGKRADSASVKDNSRKCVVEATFQVSDYDLEPFFAEEDIDYDKDSILRREILPSGKSRAFINDTPVNLATLSALGSRLIDVHSQHQTLELTDQEFQFQLIDAIADNSANLSDYRSLLKSYRQCQSDLDTLKHQKAEAIKEYDYKTFLLNELEEAKLESENLEQLESEYETLSNVEDLQHLLMQSYQLLNADQIGLLNALSELKNSIKNASNLSSEFSPIYDRVNSVLIEIEDIYAEVEQAKDGLEMNPERLSEINGKLSIIQNLLLKHSVSTVEELLTIQQDLSENLQIFESIDDQIIAKQSESVALEKKLDNLASTLHKNHISVIPELVSKLEHILSDLGMENASFQIHVNQGDMYVANGKDNLEFLFSANKGGQAKPLKQAASGGELSRIMLAIKSILCDYKKLPTIMFDEIDTGVSGEISHKMGAIMKDMSNSMQVFTITHLPQIAAKGDAHFKVYKQDSAEQTHTHLKSLTSDERISEIAQMLGGDKMSTSAIEHAKQLLN